VALLVAEAPGRIGWWRIRLCCLQGRGMTLLEATCGGKRRGEAALHYSIASRLRGHMRTGAHRGGSLAC